MFLKEAQALADLEHPHIIRIRDYGITEEDQIPYLIMDYTPYGTLLQRHPRGSCVPLSTVVSYVKQIADALQYAHNHKRIHRDIKPENMLLSNGGNVLLSDFGLVEVVQTSMSLTSSAKSVASRKIEGTERYMAPEQFRGRPKPASDQYSLGIVAYEWLSGEPPFRGAGLALAHKFGIYSFWVVSRPTP